nr:SIZ1a [Ipomoea batatas]
MDLVAGCKDKLAYFRIKELKDVLTQLGLSKQGKKQDLVDRLLAILSDDPVSGACTKKNTVGKEEVAKLVDDIYRKMQVSGAPDLASKSQGVSDSSNVKLKEEVVEEPYQMDKIRCPCGSSLQTESMIKCEDPKCHVWQHISCVIIPEKAIESGTPPIPPGTFYCELCRLTRADPFWVTITNPLCPVKLAITHVPTDGTNPVQSVEKTFQLTKADKDMLTRQEYDLQAWCMLLNDKVQFRMQWPQYADLQINGFAVRAMNRPVSQLLGNNGRDDGPIITAYTRDGINKISLTGGDARVFCLGVRIVKRRTVQQILSSIPKVSDGELFEEALARVCRCVGGGNAKENADSDSDIEVVADSIPVNLRCPMSGSRMKVAGRFKPCVHMGCFDLEVFVEMNQRSRKWQCPICLKNYSLEHIIIDPYFNRIASKLKSCGEDVTEIEVKPDGSWRAKVEGDRRSLGDLGQWHLPDGSLCMSSDADSKLRPELLKQVKQECGSDGHLSLKVGWKKDANGDWIPNRPTDVQAYSSGNLLQENFEMLGQDIISSSATGSGKEGEDPSVNQDGNANLDFSTPNGFELESMSHNIDQAYAFSGRNLSAPSGDAEVIVLSDSEEENEPLISPEPVYTNNRTDAGSVSFSLQQGIQDPYSEEPPLANGGNSCLDRFDVSNDDFGMSMWSSLPNTQGGPGFQFFDTDPDVSGSLVDVQHGSINCPTGVNGYGLATDTTLGSADVVPESYVGHPTVDINDGLVDNHLSFDGNDSLQIFLPTRPSDTAIDIDMRDQPDVSNGVRNEDLISLRLGVGGIGSHGDLAAVNGFNSVQQLQSKDGGGSLDSLADTASLLLGMNDNNKSKKTRERSDSPFSISRQRRAVRPRLYLSIDSDSE